MRAIVAGMLAGAGLVLTGCGTPQTSGIVAIGPDTYAVETRGRALATAVERGLTEATSFCTAQSRQTELLGTRINADSYQVAFRCVGGSGFGGSGFAGNPGIIGRVPAGYGQRNSVLGPIPISAPIASAGRGPVITGQAFPPAAPPPPGLELGTVGSLPGRTATVAGNPFGQRQVAVAPAPSLPPLSSLPANAAFQAPPQAFAPAFSAPAAASAPVATSPFQPLQSPLAASSAPSPVSLAPLSAAPAPAFAPLSAPAAPAFQPLASQPAASPAFQPLAQPQPLGSLPGASSALPAVAAPRSVPSGPASVPSAASGTPLGQPGTLPPAGFWNSPAR